MPTAALSTAASERSHGPEGHQIARAWSSAWAGSGFGSGAAASASAALKPLAVCTSESKPRRAAHGPCGRRRTATHRRCRAESSPPPPGRSRARRWRPAGSPARKCRRPGTVPRALAPARLAQIDKGRQFSAAGVDDERPQRRQVRCADQQHVGAMHRERAAAHRTGNDAGQVQDSDSGQRPLCRGQRFGRRIADLLDAQQRKRGDRAALRMPIPLGEGAARGSDEPGVGGRSFERLAFPVVERALYRRADRRRSASSASMPR